MVVFIQENINIVAIGSTMLAAQVIAEDNQDIGHYVVMAFTGGRSHHGNTIYEFFTVSIVLYFFWHSFILLLLVMFGGVQKHASLFAIRQI